MKIGHRWVLEAKIAILYVISIIAFLLKSCLNSVNFVDGGSNVSSVNSEDSFQYFIDQIETIYIERK